MDPSQNGSKTKPGFEEYLKYYATQRLNQLKQLKEDMEVIKRTSPELIETKTLVESMKERHPYKMLTQEDEDWLIKVDPITEGTKIKEAEERIKLRCSGAGLKQIIHEIVEEARRNHKEGKEIPKPQSKIVDPKKNLASTVGQHTGGGQKNTGLGVTAVGGTIHNPITNITVNGNVSMGSS